MELPIDSANEEQFKYIYNMFVGKGKTCELPDGTPVYDTILHLSMPLIAANIFEERYNKGQIPCRYKYENYINDEELQATIKGLQLEPDAFFLLIMFLYDYSYSICLNGFTVEDSAQRKIEKLLNLETADSYMRLSFQSSKGSIDIRDTHSLELILKWIGEAYNDNKDSIKGYTLEETSGLFQPKQESVSVVIWYFATLLRYFFEINPQFKGTVKRGHGVSLNKNLLISQLIYHTRLTSNQNFLYDTDSLKGFFKQYKGKVITGHSNIYPTC